MVEEGPSQQKGHHDQRLAGDNLTEGESLRN